LRHQWESKATSGAHDCTAALAWSCLGCGVEGDEVFAQLLANTGNRHLQVVTGPTLPTDLRTIDVFIADDDRKLRVADEASFMAHLRYPTRDIFHVIFEVIDTNDPLVVIASH
jgi:hypothetical protein